MRVGIFDPYLDSMGGGERYAMALGEWFLKSGHRLEVFWPTDERIKIEQRFAINLKGAVFASDMYKLCLKRGSWLAKRKKMSAYDLIFWVSDGSIPFLFAKRNWLHFQIPFGHLGSNKWLMKLKLLNLHKVIYNSEFTHLMIDPQLQVGDKAYVLYPPVDVDSFSAGRKENLILSVGRFTRNNVNSKRQDVLIRAFSKLVGHGMDNWKLLLVGSCLDEDEEYLRVLRKLAANLPVQLAANVPFDKLRAYYAQASIYWHAAGYGVDEKAEPQKVEHFGIAVVEAMAAGCIPLVVGRGGLKEIIEDKKNGFFWHRSDDLVAKTESLIADPLLRRNLSKKAQLRARLFSKDMFFKRLSYLFGADG